MLARLLPLLAIVVLCILGYFVYTQETIQQLLRPTVTVVETKRQLIQGQKVRKGFIEAKPIGINRVTAGMITFPNGTTAEQVETALAGQSASRNIRKGDILKSNMLGESAEIVVLRATADIGEGAALSMENIEASTLEVAPPGGAIIFDTEEEAYVYINKAYDLSARKPIFTGQVLTIEDTSGAVQKVFVVRTTRDFARQERLSINGLEAAEVANKDIPPGAIAFQTRGATDVFITTSAKFLLSESVDAGETVTAEMISASAPEIEIDPNELPQTLAELMSYMKAYPDRAMFLDESSYIGPKPEAGDRVDIWVETSRTEGEFGQVHLERISAGLIVQAAVDTSLPEETKPDQADADGAGVGDEPEQERKLVYHWISIDPAVKRRFENARDDASLAMAVHGRTKMMHLLGNGAGCLGDRCQVVRKESKDLKHVADMLKTETPQVVVTDAGGDVPLMMIDGVSAELAEKMRQNGYGSFERIADWSDTEIPAVTIKLDISNNLAVYIRQQARILSSSAENAAQELGFDTPPSE